MYKGLKEKTKIPKCDLISHTDLVRSSTRLFVKCHLPERESINLATIRDGNTLPDSMVFTAKPSIQYIKICDTGQV